MSSVQPLIDAAGRHPLAGGDAGVSHGQSTTQQRSARVAPKPGLARGAICRPFVMGAGPLEGVMRVWG